MGEHYGSDKVSTYQAPGRETDLSNLRATYIDVGECEVFRDSSVAFASNMWRCGSTYELHIWPGAFHTFDMLDDPNHHLVHIANQTKANWFKRMLKPAATVKTVGEKHPCHMTKH